MSSLSPSDSEIHQRDLMLELVRSFVRSNQVIRMGDGRFTGTVGDYSFFFEGEDDLLHVSIARLDGQRLSVEDAQLVMSFLAPDLPAGVVWLKPGEVSHHFYVGHDELVTGDE